MFERFGIHLALIFLFAFAQIGVVTHEISHVEDYASHHQQKHSQQTPSNQDSSQQDSSQQDQNSHGEQCEQCINFAKIASGLASQSFVLPVLPTSFIGSTQLLNLALSQLHTAYAARGPPTLS
jgi:hypothetical protein